MCGNPLGLPRAAIARLRRMRRLFPAVVLCALAAVAAAQEVQMGYPPYLIPNGESVTTVGVQTFVNLDIPATATGAVNTAWLGWSGSPCPAAVKIKVFRRRAETLVFVAERGPFDVVSTDFGY